MPRARQRRVRVLAVVALVGCAHARPTCALDPLSSPSHTTGVEALAQRSWSQTIADVRVTGVGEPLATTLRGRLDTQPGMALAGAPIADDLRRLWKTGVIDDARVDQIGDDLVFTVVPRIPIHRVRVVGGDAAMARRFRWLAGAQYEPARIARMAAALETHYQRDGRLDAAIEPRARRTGDGYDVCVAAALGPKVTIRKLDYPGLADRSVLAELPKRDGKLGRAGGVYDADAVAEDANALRGAYWDRGFVEVDIGKPRVERRGRHVDVSVAIREGPRYRVGAVTTSMPIDAPLPFHAGAWPARDKLWASIRALRDRIGAEDIDLDHEYHSDRHTIDFRLVIHWRWPWYALRAWRLSSR